MRLENKPTRIHSTPNPSAQKNYQKTIFFSYQINQIQFTSI